MIDGSHCYEFYPPATSSASISIGPARAPGVFQAAVRFRRGWDRDVSRRALGRLRGDGSECGKVGSRWFGALLGLAGLVLLGGAIFAYVLLFSGPEGKRFAAGPKDEVYYAGAATETDARALADALKKAGYFQDRGVSVQIRKGPQGTFLSFVVQEGVWNDADTIKGFENLCRSLAPSVGGLPITVRLYDREWTMKKEVPVK